MLLTSSDRQVSFIFTNTSQKVSALNKANFRLHFRPCSTAGEGEKKRMVCFLLTILIDFSQIAVYLTVLFRIGISCLVLLLAIMSRVF